MVSGAWSVAVKVPASGNVTEMVELSITNPVAVGRWESDISTVRKPLSCWLNAAPGVQRWPLRLTTVGPVNTFSHVEPLDHLMMLGACSVAVKVPASGNVTEMVELLITSPVAVGRWA